MADLATLESQKQALLTQLDGWSVARMSYRPAPTAWSALQVLDHVVKTEEEILIAAKQGLATPHPIGIKDRVSFFFVKKIFQSDRKVKAPNSVPQIAPIGQPALEEILQRWQSTRSDFAAFQSSLSPQLASTGIFKHPVTGWMGIQQIRDFFSVHITHHGYQLRRLASVTSNL